MNNIILIIRYYVAWSWWNGFSLFELFVGVGVWLWSCVPRRRLDSATRRCAGADSRWARRASARGVVCASSAGSWACAGRDGSRDCTTRSWRSRWRDLLPCSRTPSCTRSSRRATTSRETRPSTRCRAAWPPVATSTRKTPPRSKPASQLAFYFIEVNASCKISHYFIITKWWQQFIFLWFIWQVQVYLGNPIFIYISMIHTF